MPSRKPPTGAQQHSPMYEQLLLFPERAEYLDESRFEAYRVSLEHWRILADVFREAFEIVYERRSARVLLVHGRQGHGKSLFVRQLEQDFGRSREAIEPDPGNLWHILTGGPSIDVSKIRRAVDTTALRRVEARSGWLEDQRKFAREDDKDIRIFLFDDAQKDAFVREWAELTQGEYVKLRADGSLPTVLESVAQRMVEDCRGDFRRSVFVLLSNDERYLDDLKRELERSHQGLAARIELPLPGPSVKEEIVRTNTNLLNQRSYWFCLDQGGPAEKMGAYDTLAGDGGFTDSFQAISRALAAQHRAKRSGRPANKNLLTLVTLGTPPADVGSFVTDHEMQADEEDVHPHLGVWWFRNRWASALSFEPGGDHSRRASLVESEFSLRWVAIDMIGTWVLCEASDEDPLGGVLADIIRAARSMGDEKAEKAEKTRDRNALTAADAKLEARAARFAETSFGSDFSSQVQLRTRPYEQPITRRLRQPLIDGLKVRGALKPDVILEEYEPCAVTRAPSATLKAIEHAIKRGCHVIEITAHLQADMRGLDAYLGEKVRAYAELLESV